MTPAAVCPHCQGPIYDRLVERCTNCGGPLTLEHFKTQGPASASSPNPDPLQPSRPQRPRVRGSLAPKTLLSAASQIEVPVAPVVSGPPRLPAADVTLIADTQVAANELYLRILTHSALGLALWSLLIVPLGRLGGVPYATLPAVSAVCIGVLGTGTQPSRWFLIAGSIAAAAIVIAALWF